MGKYKHVIFTSLLVILLVVCGTSAHASKKVRLNYTKKTIYVNETATIKLLNNKKSTKWTTSNKKIKIISKSKKSAKIKAVKEGTSYLKVKVDKKTYKCKITVKKERKAEETTENTTEKTTEKAQEETFDSEEALKNISYEFYDTGRGVLVILKNNNDYNVAIDADFVYYKQGSMIETKYDFNYCIQSQKECVLKFFDDHNYENVKDYDDYKMVLTINKSKHTGYVDNIVVKCDMSDEKACAEIQNNSGKDLEFINLTCVFYDKNNKVIGYDTRYADCKKTGSVDYESFRYPKSNYETITPASCKVYVNHAY